MVPADEMMELAEDYASHVVQEAQLALVFVDGRTLPLLQDLNVPLCMIDHRSSNSAKPEAPVVTIEELSEQGSTLREMEAEQKACAAKLLAQVRSLVAIETGARVEILMKGTGWARGTVTSGEETASTFNVKIETGQEIVARKTELRVNAAHRDAVLKLLHDSPPEVLQPEVDALAAIAVRLAGTEDTAARRARWIASVKSLRPTKLPSLVADAADLEDTLTGLARLWGIEGDTEQGAEWEALALRSGQRAWADAVLAFICEEIDGSTSDHDLPAGVLDRALKLLQGLARVDPRTAALACDVATRLDYTVQEDWFDAVAKVETEGLALGQVYRLLRDADLVKGDDQSSTPEAMNDANCAATATVVRVAAGAIMEVVQLEGTRAKVRSDFGTGWLDLFQPDPGRPRIRKGARVRVHGFDRAVMNGLEGMVTQEASSSAEVKVRLQDVSRHKAQVDPGGKKPLLARMKSGTVGVIPEEKLQIVEQAAESLVLGEPESSDGMATLMVLYTSGSTGLPKGALIADRSFLGHIDGRAYKQAVPRVSEISRVHVRAGPLSTTGEMHGLWASLMLGGRVGLIRDPSRLFDVLEGLAPDILFCVPQMWAVLHKRFQRRETECVSDEEKKQVHQEVRRLIGHRIIIISAGSAMPAPEVMAWLRSVFPRVEVRESYGTTETGPGSITSSGPEAACRIRRFCEVKLKDSPPFFATDKPFPRGAVWVKTSEMAQGYLNRPDETRSSFDSDGFFDTGDIGEMISPTQLRLIDRRKNTFKLSNGEWVTPEKIEGALSAVLDVQQIFVHGNSSVSTVVAIVVSDSTPQHLSASFAQARAAHSLRHFEVPAQILVVQERWTDENGLLTGSHKLNRHAVRQKFASELDSLLDEVRRVDEAAVDSDVARATQLIRAGEDAVGWREMSATLQGNSILAQKVAFALKDGFGVDVPVIALLSELELGDLVGFIRGEHSLESLKPVDWNGEAKIDEMLTFQQPEGDGEVLLTGSTGHVGAAVLEALLHESAPDNRPVCCLVRAASNEAALRRVVDTLVSRGYDVAAARAESGDGVRCIAGDLSVPLLGLDEAQFEALAESTSVILNVGCWVHHLANYQQLKASNVDSVATLLRLASVGPRTRFVQVSTTSARNGAAGGGYSQSKWVAERMVDEAIKRGLDGAVLQLGFVGPDRRTGAANVVDRVMRFVAGTIQLGVHHSLAGARVQLFPVEVCAAAIVQLSTSGSGDGAQATAKLQSVTVPVKQLMERVGSSPALRGRRMHAVSRAVWQAELQQLSEQNPMFPLISHYQDGLPGERARDLESANDCPTGYGQAEVDRFVAFLQTSGQLGAVPDLPTLVRTSSLGKGQQRSSADPPE